MLPRGGAFCGTVADRRSVSGGGRGLGREVDR
jgi:hypothetical protein